MSADVDPRPPEVVLFTDDDVGNRIVFEQVFRPQFNIITCSGGEEALAVFDKHPVAVLLTDQRMPGMTGTELLRRVRERSPHTVGVVVTAYEDSKPIIEAVNQQLASRYLLKPWNASELQTVISWGIEVYRLAREKGELEIKLLQGERFTTLGSITAGVLHDMAQPLTVLRAHLDLLGRQLDRARAGDANARARLESQLPEIVSDMSLATQQLGDVAESAQRFLASTQAAVGPAAVGDIALAARYAMTLCKPKVAAHGGTMRFEVAPLLPPVSMPTSSLTQIMVNLVVNGAQALVRGRPGSFVELRAARSDGGIEISVRDNGAGMPPEVLARARDAFFTTKPVGVGTGIGLYNTDRLAREAGGRLGLASVENEGTTATVWLPVAAEREQRGGAYARG